MCAYPDQLPKTLIFFIWPKYCMVKPRKTRHDMTEKLPSMQKVKKTKVCCFGLWPSRGSLTRPTQKYLINVRVNKWTSTFELLSIPSWTDWFKPHPHTRHLGGPMSTPSNNVVCLLRFAWRRTHITMTEIWHYGYSKASVLSDLAKLGENWYGTDNINISKKLNFLACSWNHEQTGSLAKLT